MVVVIKYYCIIVINNIVRDDTSLQGCDVISFGKVTTVLEAVIGNQLQISMAFYPRKLESASTLLREPQILQHSYV